MNTSKIKPVELLEHTCFACGHHVAVPFHDGGQQPLATIAWPETESEAVTLPRYPLNFVRCVSCGHIFNPQFSYEAVPYSKKPNLMFNTGTHWVTFLAGLSQRLIASLPASPTVIEIGCGEGHLLRAMARSMPGRYIGFDPNASINTDQGVIEARNEYFQPTVHLADLKPDLIIMRHVLEHLLNPRAFLQAISTVAEWTQHPVQLYAEVPCVDRVCAASRIADFYYEHCSHFTTQSFTALLDGCSANIAFVEHGYQDEVVYGLAVLGKRSRVSQHIEESVKFRDGVSTGKHHIQAQLQTLVLNGETLTIWGGTGKAACFIGYYDLDRKRFPIVVDSDPLKVGTYVPGTGQLIQSRDILKHMAPTTILIPPQWRAKDIVTEIDRHHIPYNRILIEHNGALIDYHRDPHPYGSPTN